MGRRIGIVSIAVIGAIVLLVSHRSANSSRMLSTVRATGALPAVVRRPELAALAPFASLPLAQKVGARTTGNVHEASVADKPAKTAGEKEGLLDAKPAGEKEALLNAALRLIDKHEFFAARRLLRRAMSGGLHWNELEDPEMKAAHRAQFAMGLSFYREGGIENLRTAQVCLDDFLFFPDDEIFVQAAKIDIIKISMELMQSEETEEARLGAAHDAEVLLKKYLQQWPSSPYTQFAVLSLDRVQEYQQSRRPLVP